MPEKTLDDIEQVVVLVQIDGNCHQALISEENKKVILHLIANMTDGLKLSEEMLPIVFQFKKENPND